MSEQTVDQNVLLDDENLDKGFDEALEDLQKALTPETEEELIKSDGGDEDDEPKKGKSKIADEDEDEEEDEEADEEDVEKSMEDFMNEDEEAAAAMDVEPYLLQMVKSFDEMFSHVLNRLGKVESLTKSIGQMTVAGAKLSKSMNETVAKIGGTPIPPKSVTVMAKSRFGEGKETVEVDNQDLLMKSRNWVQAKKINLEEAGMIEGRVNKNLVGRVGDALDSKVQELLKEESK